jgi:hypothetical protein
MTDSARVVPLPAHELVPTAVAALKGSRRLFLVKAPPGSGKTTLLLGVLRELRAKGKRLAVGTQTNSQADDLCERWIRHGLGPITRLVSSGDDRARPNPIQVCNSAADLPHGPCIVVANTKKWAWTQDLESFDVLCLDEAWQMSWADFAALPHVAENFMLIGDPGQIQPIVTVDTSRWETAPVGPHRPAPEVLLERGLGVSAAIDHTWRLPLDTTELVRGFYDFAFSAKAAPGARRLLVETKGVCTLSKLVAMARDASIVAATRGMPAGGTVPDDDPEVAIDVAKVVDYLLRAKARIEIDGVVTAIDPSCIGITATHRVMLSSIRDRLPPSARDVICETPERWQGLERPVMLAVHPLSSTTNPSAFDLATGRLCVMASRHKAALFVFSRSHVMDTLTENRPEATQAPSRPDDIGRGHSRHTEFWRAVDREGRVVRLD